MIIQDTKKIKMIKNYIMLLYYIKLNTHVSPNNNVVVGAENIFQK